MITLSVCVSAYVVCVSFSFSSSLCLFLTPPVALINFLPTKFTKFGVLILMQFGLVLPLGSGKEGSSENCYVNHQFVAQYKVSLSYWQCIVSIFLLCARPVWPQVYFLVFLCVLTLWGCYKSMGRTFGYVRIILLCYTGSHIITLHLYQFQFFQDAVNPSQLIPRFDSLNSS